MSHDPFLWVCPTCTQGNGTELNSCVYCGCARPAICEYRKLAPKTSWVEVLVGLAIQITGYVGLSYLLPNGVWVALFVGLILEGYHITQRGRGKWPV